MYMLVLFFKSLLFQLSHKLSLLQLPNLDVCGWMGSWVGSFVRMHVRNFLFTLGLLPRMTPLRG